MASHWSRPNTSNRKVVVLGAGVLGRRISASWIAGGYDVNLRDTSEAQLNAAKTWIKDSLPDFASVSGSRRKAGKLEVHVDLGKAVEDAWLVVEAVPEKLNIKIDVMGDLDKVVPNDCIVGSNSSSFKSSRMLDKVQPEHTFRVCSIHYQMPPKANTVEIMTDGQTNPDIIQLLYEKLEDCGMLPVIARKESTGLILNRLWAAIKRETMLILAEGVSVPEEIDTLFVRMFGSNPQGPCSMMDSVGLDTVAFIEDNYVEERHLDPTFTVKWLRENYISKGLLGAKSGKGGLYPVGSTTTKPSPKNDGQNNAAAGPILYFLDLGTGANFDLNKGLKAGSIMTASADGSNIKTLIADVMTPDGIDVSLSAGRIFWTSMGVPGRPDGSVLSAKLDGSNVKVIVGSDITNTPKQLVIDHENSKLYFCDREGQKVHRCNFDGSGHEVIVQVADWEKDGIDDQKKWCVGITVDSVNGKFYWSQKGASKSGQGRIFRANIDMPHGETAASRSDIELLFDKLPEPIDLEVDPLGQILYWTDRGEYPLGNTLSKASVGPTGDKKIMMLARHFHEAIGMKIDNINKQIYVADLGGAIYRFNMDGSDRRKIIDSDNVYTGIAIATYEH